MHGMEEKQEVSSSQETLITAETQHLTSEDESGKGQETLGGHAKETCPHTMETHLPP